MEQNTSYGQMDVKYTTKPDFSVEESVISEIRDRAKKGYAKYGATMTREDLSLRN